MNALMQSGLTWSRILTAIHISVWDTLSGCLMSMVREKSFLMISVPISRSSSSQAELMRHGATARVLKLRE